jgi:hypothetical protein
MIEIWTDGGCRPNPGRGGWGVVIKDGEAISTFHGGRRRTTNNRMEFQAVIERAKDGEVQAARIVLDRILPIRKGRAVEIDLPVLKTAGDVVAGIGALARAMADGEITPDEAQVMASVIEVQRKAIETTEFEARLDALEDRQQ